MICQEVVTVVVLQDDCMVLTILWQRHEQKWQHLILAKEWLRGNEKQGRIKDNYREAPT